MQFSALLINFIAAMAIFSQLAFAADTSLQTQALTSHNNYRAKHHVAALRWNKTLATHAASVANTCVFAHSVLPGTGQNIAYGYPTMTATVDTWYNEVVNYDYATGNSLNGKTTGHFTQIVWKGTTDLGCASQVCSSLGGATFYVCDYSPSGNYYGEYTQNVFKP